MGQACQLCQESGTSYQQFTARRTTAVPLIFLPIFKISACRGSQASLCHSNPEHGRADREQYRVGVEMKADCSINPGSVSSLVIEGGRQSCCFQVM